MRSLLVGFICGLLLLAAPAALLVLVLAYLLLPRPPTPIRQNATPGRSVGEPYSPKFTTSPRDGSTRDNVVQFPDPSPARPRKI